MCHGRDAGDRNASRSKARHILESLDCKRHVVDHPASLGQEFPSHRRQMHRSRRSIQQTHTKICLQLLESPRKGSLRDMKTTRRFAEPSELGDHHERLEAIKIDLNRCLLSCSTCRPKNVEAGGA
jgi:hypothetical protein